MRTLPSILGLVFFAGATGCLEREAPHIDPPPCFDCCDFGDCCGGAPGDFECHPPPPEIDVSRLLPPLAQAAIPPAPISGGTLHAAASGLVLAGDPDRDVVHVVDVEPDAESPIVATVELPEGSEPGRIVETADGVFFVALRGGGGVARIDAETWTAETLATCASPRGLAVDDAAGALLVSCLEGDLVTLDVTTGEETRRVFLDRDLRDIVIEDDHVFVARFRQAEVLVLDAEGALLARHALESGLDEFVARDGFRPSVSYRMIENPDGGVLVLHQLSRTDGRPVQIDIPGGYGGLDCTPSIVQAATSSVTAEGVVATSALGNLVLPVDIALPPRNFVPFQAAIAAAGARTDDVRFDGFGGGFAGSSPSPRAPGVSVADLTRLTTAGQDSLHCEFGGHTFGGTQRATSVAYRENGQLVVLTRSPDRVLVLDPFAAYAPPSRAVDLPGEPTYDAGHELFFGDAGGGIACGSCHAEGGEDAQTWTFSDLGPRRTQDIRGGILGTEPFHWDGDMEDFAMLSREVFASRMQGPILDADYADALVQWIDATPFPERGDRVDALAAERGRILFESNETKCTLCHSGPRMANEGSFDVGTGGDMQVPSLIGVALRAPFIHTGCADTLLDRFDPSCGGDVHGVTDHLGPEDLDDLVAYLESL